MFKSSDYVWVKPYICRSMPYVLVIGKGFLRIRWSNFLKSFKNSTVPLFFGWIKVGYHNSDLFNLFSTSNWHKHSTYFMKTALWPLGTGYRCAWYILASCCNSISTGLVLYVPNVPLNRNSYLDRSSCNSSRLSYAIF